MRDPDALEMMDGFWRFDHAEGLDLLKGEAPPFPSRETGEPMGIERSQGAEGEFTPARTFSHEVPLEDALPKTSRSGGRS